MEITQQQRTEILKRLRSFDKVTLTQNDSDWKIIKGMEAFKIRDGNTRMKISIVGLRVLYVPYDQLTCKAIELLKQIK